MSQAAGFVRLSQYQEMSNSQRNFYQAVQVINMRLSKFIVI